MVDMPLSFLCTVDELLHLEPDVSIVREDITMTGDVDVNTR